MLNVKVTGLLCISMLPVASSCNLFVLTVNFYASIYIKKTNCDMKFILCCDALLLEVLG